jgi:TolB protein
MRKINIGSVEHRYEKGNERERKMKRKGIALLVSILVMIIMSSCATPVAVSTPMPINTSTPPPATSTPQPTTTPTTTPTPTPVSQRIAFSSRKNGSKDIYTVNGESANVSRLTYTFIDAQYPDWSPDGKQIAFTETIDLVTGIFVMKADGTSMDILTKGLTPDWSPDGNQIAFTSLTGIAVINIDGSDLTQFTTNGAYTVDWYPKWSLDGTAILFIRIKANIDSDQVKFSNPTLYIMNADGTNARQVSPEGMSVLFPAWTPAAEISFVSKEGLYKINSDGSGLMCEYCSAEIYGDFSGGYTWSPDGLQIAFSSKLDGDLEIYVMNQNGTNIRQLTDNDDIDWMPAWQP